MAKNTTPKPARRPPAAQPVKPKPRYSEIADQIRLHIMTGRYPVGSLLPSEADLRLEFGVSRHTVREAARQLQVDGFVSAEQGRGIRVASDKAVSRLNVVFGSLEGIERYGRVTHLVEVQSRMIRADAQLAELLRLGVGDEVLHMQSHREPRDPTLMSAPAWNETFIPSRFAGIKDEVEHWSGAIYSLIEQRFGERVVSIRQEARALNLNAQLARHLKVKTGTAGLQVQRTYINASGTPLMMGSNTYVGSRFTLVMDIQS